MPTQEEMFAELQAKKPEEILALAARAWTARTQMPTLVIWLPGYEEITRAVAEEVFLALRKLEGVPETLWVMLNSLGGDLSAAYQIARQLQLRSKRVHVLVPRRAKSAATLITLGCHEVVMHPMAELGPIDTQVTVVRDGTKVSRSTLDGLKSLEYLREFAVTQYVRTLWMLRETENMTVEGASRLATGVMSALADPLFGRIDPLQMGEFFRLLETSREYGRRLLEVSYADKSAAERRQLLAAFVESYPAHGFIIDVVEARAMGLRASMADEGQRTILDFSIAFGEGRGRVVDLFLPR